MAAIVTYEESVSRGTLGPGRPGSPVTAPLATESSAGGGFWNTRHVTADGLERTFALNHLAPFLLTSLPLDRLKHSARPAWSRSPPTSAVSR